MTDRATRSQLVSDRIALGICVWALLTLLGWQLDNDFLRGAWFGTFVAPNTSLCFIVSGLALWAVRRFPRGPGLAAGLAGAAFVFLFGLQTLAEYVTGLKFGIDPLFFSHRLHLWTVDLPPGRFVITTAVAFIFVGLAIAALRLHTRFPLAQGFASVIIGIAYLGLLGYVLQLQTLYARWMAVYTALIFVALALAIFASQPHRGITAVLISERVGGILARRMLFAAILVVPLLGRGILLLHASGFISGGMAYALLIVSCVVLFTGLILRTAVTLDQAQALREKAEVALRDNEKLSAAGRFAATIAHEINNPLAAVTNLVYLSTQDPDLPPRTRNLLKLADDELKRVALISRQTLGFYKEESYPERFSVADLFQELAHLFRSKSQERKVGLDFSAPSGLTVFAVKGEVRQALANLVANAIDASRAGAAVVLRTTGSDGISTLTVADAGRGIPLEAQRRLFEPFFTTKAAVGNGLGLWIAKNLIERNGGTITFRSEPDAGTEFRVELPAKAARPAEVRALSAAVPSTETGS